jgi:ATP-binding cassette subfamily F protein uup
MAPPLLSLQDIHLSFGGAPVLEGAAFFLAPSERLCLVGRNGSGKSTLLKIAAGLIEADSGVRFVQPGTTLRYLPQEPDLSGYATTLDYVKSGLGPGDDPHRARYLLEHLGLAGDEAAQDLSGGEARRAALARVLSPQPDILLLDEPTNHLDLPAIEWLEAELAAYPGALVLISHDRRFLSKLTRSSLWIDRGRTRSLERGFAHFESWRDEQLEAEALEQHKLERKIVREEHWLTYGVTARRKRNQKRLAGLHELRRQRREYIGPAGVARMNVTSGATSGRIVAEAINIFKAYGDKPVVKDFSIRVQRGDRIGIVGPNGAGKTTILKLLTGELEPDSGEVRLGTNLQLVCLDQRRVSLDPEQTLRDALTDGSGDTVHVNGAPRHVIGYMKDFLFAPEQARTPIKALSGGERGRLMLAKALARPSNFLVLDEPTNDLDLETLDLLQELLAGYDGTVLVVSHDRDFLDRVATSIIAPDHDGVWREYAGGYCDMILQRDGAKTPDSPAQKHKKPASSRKPSGLGQKKMTYKDKHALETLPARIEELQQQIDQLHKALEAPDLFTRNPEKFAQITADLEKAQNELETSEEKWLTLEMLREELEG